MNVIRRGEVWTANLNPSRGSEVGEVWPVLIVQGDWLTRTQSQSVVVLPLTSRVRAELEPLRVTLNSRDGLLQDSQVIVEQPRTLDRRRIGQGPLTQITREEMSRVEQSLRAVLGFALE